MSEQPLPPDPHDGPTHTPHGGDRISRRGRPGASAEALRDGFVRSGMQPSELWAGYVSMGGNLTQSDVLAAMFRDLPIRAHDHNMIAQALNEHFIDVGLNHLVPYHDQLDHGGGQSG